MQFLDFYQGFKTSFAQQEFFNYGRRLSKFSGHDDVQQVIVKFEQLKQGCLVWIKGDKYPIRGNMITDKVEDLSKTKKIALLFFNFLASKEINVFKKILVFVSAKQYCKLLLGIAHWQLKDIYYIGDEIRFYSQPTIEIYRSLSGWSLLIDKIRDIICAIIEFDMAYRYRAQDGISLINKDAFAKKPIKELKRVAGIFFDREQGGSGIVMFFEKYKFFIFLYLVFNRKIIKQLQKIVEKIDIKEVELSKEDIYWSNKNWSYNFRGIPAQLRLNDYIKQKNEKKRDI